MAKALLRCEHCGKEIMRHPSHIHQHNYCSRECLGAAITAKELIRDTEKTSAHMSEYNRKHNPTATDFSRRTALRNARLGTGKKNGYTKRYGTPEHVLFAEQALGRKLKPDEVVHHIDRNKRNNSLDNLVVMTRSEHSRLHMLCRGMKEVMSDAFQALSVSASGEAVDSRS